ncbi:hypothetical protein [Salirhabdus salicampi]|uniref:hypothetical protein n=1 Tax=Salirhabdus salicampi TaxID=476102 RepID=UPI0020C1E360|nr:hypothetical protein [Salirhabdus salicampi]MCP8616014.1 hypothetical protein [Salirhabdus salicampi]
MTQLYVNRGDKMFVNSSNKTVLMNNGVRLEPVHDDKFVEREEKCNVKIPSKLLEDHLCVYYDGKKGLCFVGIEIPYERYSPYHSVLQVIHLAPALGEISIRARYGDSLQNIHYQQKTECVELSPRVDVVLDFYMGHQKWKTLSNLTTKKGMFYVIIVTDHDRDPFMIVEINSQ